MTHPLYTLLCLLIESLAARRDAQVRFLKEENRILRARIPGQRLILAPEERGRLLAIGRELGHHVKGLVSIVQFRTYQRWVKEQEAGRKVGRVGRPRTIGSSVRKLIVRLAKENPGWGYFRIVAELMKLRVKVSKTSVRRILREEGLYPDPSPGRPYRVADEQPWDRFLKLHLNTLVACDFFCKTIWTPLGQRQAYLMVFLHVGSRKVWVSPATYRPDTVWVNQQGRHALMWLEDHGIQATHLIRDRDSKFAGSFDQLMNSSGIKIVKSPVQAPNANAFAEAWVASLKRECLNYFGCFSLRHLEHITYAYTRYYNEYRPHQRLGNQVLRFPHEPPPRLRSQPSDRPLGRIGCRSELGGLLRHYYRRAA